MPPEPDRIDLAAPSLRLIPEGENRVPLPGWRGLPDKGRMKGCGMAIPTKEEFDSWLALATAPVFEVGASLPAMPAASTVADAVDYLCRADAEHRRRWCALLDQPASQWLLNQREFLRARERVFRTRRQVQCIEVAPPFDYFVGWAQRLYELADDEANGEAALHGLKGRAKARYRADSFRGSIERHGNRPVVSSFRFWYTTTMRSVAEYLEGNAAASFLDAVAEIERAADAAQEAVARFLHLSRILNGSGFPGTRESEWGLHQWRDLTRAADIALPIGSRKDQRANERLFVYRMFVANRNAVGSARPGAIVGLMGLEGFRHQYEMRTIERLCKQFEEAHNRPSR